MRYLPKHTTITAVCVALVVTLVLPAPCLAAKGGGKPGGGDPPPLPSIQYSVLPVTMPGASFQYTEHNDDLAVIGWNTIEDPALGRRSFAYLPGISTTEAFYLDELSISGIPAGWHTRSAIGINNHNTIVGNLEPDGDTTNSIKRPFIVPDIYAPNPELHVLGPFDPLADRESVFAINDSGDLVILSERGEPGIYANRVFVAQGPFDPGTAPSIMEIDFAAAGISIPDVYDDAFGKLRISDAVGNNPVVISGGLSDGDQEWIFRASADRSSFEKLGRGTALFTEGTETHSISSGPNDMTNNGDLLLTVRVESSEPPEPRKKNKTQLQLYAAIWRAEDSTVVPVPGSQEVGAALAWANEDGDFLLHNVDIGKTFLWHGDWSIDNGPVAIVDLLDPNDSDASLFWGGLDLTDRDPTTGWPNLLGRPSNSGSQLLVLNPHATAGALTTAVSVPEPTTGFLAMAALSLIIISRRKTRGCSLSSCSKKQRSNREEVTHKTSPDDST